ncbi:MAG: sigma-54-dependent Fis family transcriptional regulator [Acidobacteria bacterium]|nr:sigma-54-dependent Fis family transcriptional regulator [Acidobacteriota bacterium]
MKAILVIATDAEACKTITECLRAEYKVEVHPNKEACLDAQRKKRYEFILIDLLLLRDGRPVNGYFDYKAVLQPFWQAYPMSELIVMSQPAMIRDAVMAVKQGASNYITYPIHPDELRYVKESLQEALKIHYELQYLRDSFWQEDSLELIRTNSPVMKEVFGKVRAVSTTKTTVLLTGETGTGKGVVAKLIHQHSTRRDNQFIAIHCGAIPDTLLESELFGHEKGAFTGAIRRKLGKFEISQGGTIFLDEISTISPSMQIKLLQILQDRTFQRVGGEDVIEVDVRILAATNEDLGKMCDDGSFRRDLYYRLNVFPIELPPLRTRLEDIPVLTEVFLDRLNRHHLKDIVGIHPLVMEAFTRYTWPGNIRELENLVERAYILETSSMLTPESFPSELFASGDSGTRIEMDTSLTLAEIRHRTVESVERRYLKEMLTLHRGKIAETAKATGISVRQLHKLMARYGIRKEDFKYIPLAKTKKEL